MANLNLTPTNDGTGVLRINIPPLTEDRRKELVKQAKVISEEGRCFIHPSVTATYCPHPHLIAFYMSLSYRNALQER